jgi:hypothetical protein
VQEAAVQEHRGEQRHGDRLFFGLDAGTDLPGHLLALHDLGGDHAPLEEELVQLTVVEPAADVRPGAATGGAELGRQEKKGQNIEGDERDGYDRRGAGGILVVDWNHVCTRKHGSKDIRIARYLSRGRRTETP